MRTDDHYFTYPDEYVFVFNPLYIYGENLPYNSITLVVESVYKRTCKVALMNGSAKIYISNILQAVLEPFATNGRGHKISVDIYTEDGRILLWNFELFGIWGALAVGDRYNAIGWYHFDAGKPYFTRYATWFKNYPFSFSALGEGDTKLRARYDGNGYGAASAPWDNANRLKDFDVEIAEAKRKIVYRIDPANATESGTFDDTFDYTFHMPDSLTTLIEIDISDQKEGCYLRWIDRFGNIEYYLFDKGEDEFSVTRSEDFVEREIENPRIDFMPAKRPLWARGKHATKCAAVHLNKHKYDMVATILTSPVVDLFIGHDQQGREIWQPVNITGDSITREADTNLQQIEIIFETPQINSQTL